MPDKQTVALVLMFVIVNKGKGEKIGALLSEHGSIFNLLLLAKGTADKKILSYLGLGETEKDLVIGAFPVEMSWDVLEKLHHEKNFKAPGKGVAFTVPINGYGDQFSKRRLKGKYHAEGGKAVEQVHQYDLILAISNQGYSEEVMDAAKSAKAAGGTILHARGIGLKQAEKFFGITIQPEKEMVMILAKRELRQGIMSAIAEQKGCQTEAKTVVFSLPVSGIAGLPALCGLEK